MKKLLIIFIALLFSGAIYAQDFNYIGALKCKMCHNSPTKGQQYKLWKETKHANAMDVLSEAEKANAECVSCHATSEKFLADGVSCESCHGPGSIYKSMTIMKDQAKSIENGLTIPTEEVCKKCHNEKSAHFKGFDYAKYKELVKH